MERQSSRLRRIQATTLRVALSLNSARTEDLELLAQLSYQVRKSTTFFGLVRRIENPRLESTRPGVSGEIIERIGQLSKFARAASTVTRHLRKMILMDITVTISGVPASSIEILELSQTSASQLRHRGGQRYSGCKDGPLQSMINRWPKYREHAEMQLIMFYEENPDKVLHTPYIGCNKQSCFLCFQFVAQHGRFSVGGCHQSLYSLWTIRDMVKCGDAESAAKIKYSLTRLSETLEQMVEDRRKPFWRSVSKGTGKESVPNLSRTSLASSQLVNTSCEAQRPTLDTQMSAESHATSNHLRPISESEERISSMSSASNAGDLHVSYSMSGAQRPATRLNLPSRASSATSYRAQDVPLGTANRSQRRSYRAKRSSRKRRGRVHKQISPERARGMLRKQLGKVKKGHTRRVGRQRAAQECGPCTPLRALRKVVDILFKVAFGISRHGLSRK